MRIPDRHFQAISINDRIVQMYQKLDFINVIILEQISELDAQLRFHDPKAVVILWGAFYQYAQRYPDFFHVGQLGDHPFASWIIESINTISNNVLLTYVEPSFAGALNKINPEYTNHSYIKGTVLDLNVVDQKDESNVKEIDYILALSMRSQYSELRSQLKAAKSDLKLSYDLYNECIDRSLFETSQYINVTFDSVLAEKNISWGELSRATRGEALNILHNIDMYVRHHRRSRFINTFVSNIANTGAAVYIIADSDIKCPGVNLQKSKYVNYRGYINLVKMSRINVFSMPTYPNVIDHRIVVSSYLKCGVYCDTNQRVRDDKLIVLDSPYPILEKYDLDLICKANVAQIEAGGNYALELLFTILQRHEAFT